MPCAISALMDNGFCKDTGRECPRDKRCDEWLEMENPILNKIFRNYDGNGPATRGKSWVEEVLESSGESNEGYSAYASLDSVLNDAFEQAANGKGKDRHATDNNYEDQVICAVQRLLLDHPFGYQAGQVMKKIIEAGRLFKQGKHEAAYIETGGAINYAAAQGILIKELGGIE